MNGETIPLTTIAAGYADRVAALTAFLRSALHCFYEKNPDAKIESIKFVEGESIDDKFKGS